MLRDTGNDGAHRFAAGVIDSYHFAATRRPTKDIDIFVKAGDYPKILNKFTSLGYKTQVSDERWIAKIFKGADLEKILHSWKSYTSNQANALLKRRGSFWWREYYDHCVRDEDELTRSVRYVLDNPAKAGLKDWPYVWCAGW